MKIVWLINAPFSELCKAAGLPVQVKEGWIEGLYHAMMQEKDGAAEIVIVFPQMKQPDTIEGRLGGCDFFGFYKEEDKPYKYNPKVTARLREILDKTKPDAVHIAGTEYDHAYSMVKAFHCPERTVVSVQGLTSVYAKHYMADLPFGVRYGYTFRDIIKHDNLRDDQKKYIRRGQMEEAVIRAAGHVIGRTQWDMACVKRINPSAKYHYCGEILRSSFYGGEIWKPEQCEKHSVFVTQGYYPIKGLHYMLEGLSDIKRFYPDVRLYVAGGVTLNNQGFRQRIRRKRYQKYLAKLIKEYQLAGNVTFLQSLDGAGMKERFLKSNVFVQPSSIENSPNSLAEAMILGTPCVASYVGGTADMLEHGSEGFLYQHDAPYMLAHYVMKVFAMTDDALPELTAMTGRAKKRIEKLFDRKANGRRMLEIYAAVCGEKMKEQGLPPKNRS